MPEVAVYIACAAGRSVDIFDLDLMTGGLEPVGAFRAEHEVQCLAMGRGHGMVFAPVKSSPPSVLSLRVDPETGELSQAGTGPLAAQLAYASVDHSGRYLLGASYHDHLVTTSAIDGDGVASGAVAARANPGRHAHAVLAGPDNRFVYATALGDDAVLWWSLDAETGALTPVGSAQSPAGSGPRHLRFSHGGDFLYVLHEMSGDVLVYAVDRQSGGLELVQSISSIPAELGLVPGQVRNGTGPDPAPNAIWCAELHLVPDGSFLYSTERSTSTISIFAVDPDNGTLTFRGYTKTQAQPRGMNIDPSGQFLLACGELSGGLSVYRIDQLDGSLTELASYEVGAGPRWIEFAVVGV